MQQTVIEMTITASRSTAETMVTIMMLSVITKIMMVSINTKIMMLSVITKQCLINIKI